MKKANKVIQILKNPSTAFIGALAIAILSGTIGYCDQMTGQDEEAIKTISKKISDLLFGSTVRKVALTLGMGAGLFQAFMSGSIRPLLIYGGLGLAVCYLPAMVEWISKVA